jgi:protein-S-isoprenylcysteine O-methyltransferase Ste14
MTSPAKRHPFLVACGSFLFHYRNSLFPVAFLVIVFASMPMAPFGEERWDRLLDLVGFVVALSGQLLRGAVIGFAYIQRGGKDGRIHAEQLVQEGFFAHCRNPLYVGNMLVFLGLFIMLNSVLGYAVGVPFFLFAYVSIVAAEENYLQAKFGSAYEEYCRRVPRFFVSFRGLRRSLQDMRFDWKRLIRKEYGATFAWMTTALFLVVWEIGRRQGLPALRARAPELLGLWGLLLVGYGTARTLKKRNYFEARPSPASPSS